MINYLLILLLSFPVWLIAQNEPVSILSFELKADNRIYIQCTVNESEPLSFLFDTGANGTVINSYILGRKINLNADKETDNNGAHGIHQVKISSDNTIHFGNLKAEHIDLLTIDYGAGQFDGVFGTNLINNYIVEIDYNKKQLRFYASEGYKYPGQNAMYLKFNMGTVSNGGLYTIPSTIILDGKKMDGTYVLDTGADNALSLSGPFVHEYNIDKKLKAVQKAISTGSEGISIESPIVLIPELKLGNLQFFNITTLLYTSGEGTFMETDRAGAFGNNFLKRFNIIFDIPHQQVFLKPNNLFPD